MEHDKGSAKERRAAVATQVAGARKRVGLADAAHAALEGLHGDRRSDPKRWGVAARSPGVETLFGSGRAAPTDPPADAPAPSTEPEESAARAPADAADSVETDWSLPVGLEIPLPAPSTSPPPRPTAVGVERPVVEGLRVRRGATDVTVVATLRHGGRSISGTATALPTVGGVRRAVASATVAAVSRVASEPLLVGVDTVSVTPVDGATMVSVVLSRPDTEGERTTLGVSLATGDEDRAVMHATLDALNRVLGA